MTTTVFVNGSTLTDADWFNDTDRLVYAIFGDAPSGGPINVSTTGGIQFTVSSAPAASRRIVVAGSSTNPILDVTAGNLVVNPAVNASSDVWARNMTATPAGGTANTGFLLGSAGIVISWCSGAPTFSAAQGSLCIRADGGASTRLYVNTNGSTGWTPFISS